MIEGKTSTGFEYSIDESRLDDQELLDYLTDIMEQTDSTATTKAIRKLFPDNAERKALYDHVRTEDGRVPTEALWNEIQAIMNEVEAGKK